MKYDGFMSKGVPLRVSPRGYPLGYPWGVPPSFKAVVLSRFKPLAKTSQAPGVKWRDCIKLNSITIGYFKVFRAYYRLPKKGDILVSKVFFSKADWWYSARSLITKIVSLFT